MRVLFAFPAPKGNDPNAYSYHGDFVSAASLGESLKKLPYQDHFSITTIGPKGLADIAYDIPEGSKHHQKKTFEHLEKIQDEYDVIHYHIGGWNAINYFKKIKKPLVLTIHDPPTSGLEYSFYSREPFIKAIDSQKMTIVYPTQQCVGSFLNRLNYLPAEKITTFVRHGINVLPTEYVKTLISNVLIEDKLLSVGRLDLLKNFHLASELLGPKLTVVGGFNIHGKKPVSLWTEHFAKYGTEHLQPMDKRILYTVYVNYYSYLSLCKVETFGFTAVEAASVGTPIITPNEGGLGEISELLGVQSLKSPFRKKKQLKDEILAIHEYNKMLTYDDRLLLHKKVQYNFDVAKEALGYYNIYRSQAGGL